MADLVGEIKKIPPVTRFLCLASLAVSLSVKLRLISGFSVIFTKDRVLGRFELWRVPTSFFLGRIAQGIVFIFDLFTLYQTSNGLETSDFLYRSADYAWQVSLAALAVLVINIPLGSMVHSRALLLTLAYLHSKLTPPGTQTSFLGLISFPYAYFPYILTTIDLFTDGPGAVAQDVSGMIVGHVWWWGMFDSRTLQAYGSAPGWVRRFVGGPDGSSSASGGRGGVHVTPPRAYQEAEARKGGHSWGSGRKLGKA